MPEIPAIQSDLEKLRQQLTHAPIAKTVAQAQRAFEAIERLANKVDGNVDPLVAKLSPIRGICRASLKAYVA